MSLVYRRPNSPYWYVSRTRQSTKTANRKLAEEFARKALAEHWRTDVLGEKTKTWEELITSWYDAKQHKKSLKHDRIKINHWRRWLEERTGKPVSQIPITLVTSEVIREYGTHLSRKASPGTVNNYLGLLAWMLTHASRYDWIAKVPKIDRYTVIRKEPRWLSPDEFDTIIRLLEAPFSHMVTLLVQTGLRFHNVHNMRWEWVTRDADGIPVLVIIPASETKTASTYKIPLNAVARKVLLKLQGDKRPTAGFVMPQLGIWNYRRYFERAVKKAGLPHVRIHDLRHTFASWHVLNGTSDRILAELGGWKSTAMLSVYAHLKTDHLMEHADNLNKRAGQ